MLMPIFRAAIAEALLWYAAPVDDRQAQLAVMELYGRRVRTALAPLRDHCARIVRTRVESILGLAAAQPDTAHLIDVRGLMPSLMTAPDALVHAQKPRTWIGDARIERMIETAIASAADGYAEEMENTAEIDEEPHVANLFRDLKNEFQAVNRRLAVIAVESEANKRLVLRLDYRLVPKREEGGPGLGAGRLATDVFLLVQAREGTSAPFARRVSFLQAKRLHFRKRGSVQHYPIKSKQLEDLTEQTESSYLLLVGPKRHDLAMPVLPARLVLELIARGQLSSSSLYPAALPPIARGLASWLTYDAIGLWTGDWREDAFKLAEGGERRRPVLLVEITAEMQTAGPDGWPREG